MTNRFERSAEPVGGSKAFARHEVNPRLAFIEAHDPSTFLARLWALFGPPNACDGGFEYSVHDRETNLRFSAYSGPSGPAYGEGFDERDALRPVVEAFEQLLDRTPPVDCEFSTTLDIDYGGGKHVIGWRNGRPFSGTRDARKSPTSAKSYEECVATAREHEGGYGAEAGWQQCLDRVLPEPPESLDWDGIRWENPVGFMIADGVPSILYIGRTESPEPVPVSEIPFDKPLSSVAKLWLESFERWSRGG